jgi:hypothetical protein
METRADHASTLPLQDGGRDGNYIPLVVFGNQTNPWGPGIQQGRNAYGAIAMESTPIFEERWRQDLL